MFSFGILGINARNLHYIGKYNPAKAVRLADNKITTKTFLTERGIPVPITYAVIQTHAELSAFDFSLLPHTSFIIKPARGSRGRGIFRVKKIKHDIDDHHKQISDIHTEQQLFEVQGAICTEHILKTYCRDILDGFASLQGKPDHILIEEMLLPGEQYTQFCQWGLADIRIIVYNFVPVAAMLRVPTESSEGKANLDRGGIGLGIEVGTGRIQSMFVQETIYEDSFPEPYSSFYGTTLPYREDMLQWSSQIQYYVNLGYLALDWVITTTGPKLLEINARAGLKIQLALGIPLKERLEKIDNLDVISPEKGVEICQTLFSRQKTGLISPKKVLPQHGFAVVTGTQEGMPFQQDVTVEIDLGKQGVWIDSALAKKLQGCQEVIVKYAEQDSHIPLPTRKVDTDLTTYYLIFGADMVYRYVIKPIPVEKRRYSPFGANVLVAEEQETLRLLDNKLARLSASLILSRYLKPINFLQEVDTFVTKQGAYNPVFQYQRPKKKKLTMLYDEIAFITEEFFHQISLESPVLALFAEKLEELRIKQQLLQAYSEQNLSDIALLQVAYRGAYSDELGQKALSYVASPPSDCTVLGPVLGRKRIKKLATAYLAQLGWDHVLIRTAPENYARMSVEKKGSELVLNIASGTTFRKTDLYATLAHELTHLKRRAAALENPWQLIRRGTARAFIDEEGLAVVSAEEELPDAYEKRTMRQKYLWIQDARTMDFASLAGYIHVQEPMRSWLSIFKTVYRLKRGITYTNEVDPGCVSLQDAIYVQGYERISAWLAQGGRKEDLMRGKIKIEDLRYF